ncbi:MAG: hypothetical protein EAZ90_22240 [Oscillatoriales cyanobacterium]|nr:MAG: hypothetical protein EAZ94_20070 [Oscillatoriales cyanobacterium]TAE21539.1 MAG: hypothetical protein EAZ93_20110 [Oscillatoriales cyanobacterium]TAE39682.1 MAG: hypothetical protein EAZ90_22240 [Oscillatoriales cyanobacterium]TAE56316.1 MAG: hypothetical protein EAZ88_04375 [Oscillatoriales cyanobacterium]TAE67264.1 MAG: hypothetical protein EAZ86_17615 [Oscillatoriales cyanobacterium]
MKSLLDKQNPPARVGETRRLKSRLDKRNPPARVGETRRLKSPVLADFAINYDPTMMQAMILRSHRTGQS